MGDKAYSKIMIATDGSENVKKAVSAGIDIAALTGAQVYAVTVIPKASNVMIGPKAAQWEIPHDVRKDEAERALEYVRNIGEENGVKVEEVLLEGHPSDEIINFAQKNNIDLIVMGSLGKTGFERFLVGSVAEKVVRHSTTQVLVVR